MRKVRFLVLFLASMLCFSTVVFAAEKPTSAFEFSSDSIGQEVMERVQSGETNFKITKEIETSDSELGNEISINVWVTKNLLAAREARTTETVNWALSGRYYLVRNGETVSNYGNHGSVDYT